MKPESYAFENDRENTGLAKSKDIDTENSVPIAPFKIAACLIQQDINIEDSINEFCKDIMKSNPEAFRFFKELNNLYKG